MVQRITIPFVGGTAKSRAVSVNNQETVNWYNSVKGRGAKAPMVLESIPGTREIRSTAGNGPCRSPQMVNWTAPNTTEGLLYGVFGTQLVRLNSTDIVSVVGTLDNANGIARIARGRNFIMVVDGDAGYTYNGTTFAKITDPDFPTNFASPNTGSVTHVVYLDGFFIINDATKDNFYISAKEDPTQWNALDFAAAAIAPDAALALAATESILYVPGDETTQLYYNSGNAQFPYENYLHAATEVGIAAPQSIAESDDGVFFLATTPEGGLFVQRFQGTDGSVITEDEQEEQLAAVAKPQDSYGFIYKQDGESFYVLQLDSGASTLVYNIRARTWETRALQDGTGWRPAGHGIQNFRNIIGSRLQAQMFELRRDEYRDAGEDLVRRRVTEVYHNNNQLMDWWELVIDMQMGVGLQSGAGSDPQIRLRYSDDGGQTWSFELYQPIGKQGETKRRAVFRNLGQSRNRIFEIEVADPVPVTVIAAYAVVTVAED